MTTYTLCITDIDYATLSRDGVATVHCTYVAAIDGNLHFAVDIDRASVTVRQTHRDVPEVRKPDINVARVLVSSTLVDATRRLFGLVGVA